jgi:hypothetical protein
LRRERPPPDKHRSPSRLGMVALQHMDFFLDIYHCLVLCMLSELWGSACGKCIFLGFLPL